MTAPTRADLIALLSDVEAYLAKRVDVVDVEGSGDDPQPIGANDAMSLSVDVSRMREALEKEKDETSTAALIRWLDENVSKCDHGYVFVTCGPCMSAWLPSASGVATGRFGPG